METSRNCWAERARVDKHTNLPSAAQAELRRVLEGAKKGQRGEMSCPGPPRGLVLLGSCTPARLPLVAALRGFAKMLREGGGHALAASPTGQTISWLVLPLPA